MADWGDLPLLGGHLALDFANTLEGCGGARERDRLTGYPSLVDWAQAAGAVDRREAADLRAYADWAPGTAGEVLAQARGLREALYRVASAIASGTSVTLGTSGAQGAAPQPADLDGLNHGLAPFLGATRLRVTPAGLAPAWGGAPDALERVLWPVARAAFDLMSGAEAGRLRECAGADCRRLFLDRSKNGSRRWCAMSDCGNLAKARRHRARSKRGVQPGDQAT
jgi:predicted RNA-binding Zn ribbon-like protein